MNGKQLKRIIEDSGKKTADCAIALGITPQSLNSAFHSSDVKSGTIEKVAEWLGVPVCALYGDNNITNTQIKNNIGDKQIARHSWAAIAASLDIPEDTISQALGHASRNSTTAIYIERGQRKVDEANRCDIDWVLYGKR